MSRTFRPVYAMALLLSALANPLAAQQTAPSADPIERIKSEGLNRSQIVPLLSYMTDVIGPRLTGSPAMKRANEWTRDKFAEWGLADARLEAWGPFGRGWTLERFSAQIIAPHNVPLIAYPKAWSPGVRGNHTGEVIYLDAKDEAGLTPYKGKLRGAIVLTSPIRELKARFEPLAQRRTDADLQRMEQGEGRPRQPQNRSTAPRAGMEEALQRMRFANRKLEFLLEEGAAVVVENSTRGDGGTLFVQSATLPTPPPSPSETGGARRRIAPWDKNAPKTLPQMVMATEHYNRLVRALQQGERLKMSVEMQAKFHDRDLMSYNTLADLPGTDLKEQVVMLGGHLDSWHGATGATDNATGCAVAMEAVRILKALDLKPRRTIRVALWSGEEQGLLGSRAYVAEHLGVRATTAPRPGPAAAEETLQRKPLYEKFCVYFNLDNGTGQIRGVYAQGNAKAAELFREWLKPFHAMGAKTVTMSNTGATDHIPFDSIGLPGFQFIQDTIEYDTRTHHSNQDYFDRAQIDDLKQAAVIMAAFIYNAAMRDDLLPRKESP